MRPRGAGSGGDTADSEGNRQRKRKTGGNGGVSAHANGHDGADMGGGGVSEETRDLVQDLKDWIRDKHNGKMSTEASEEFFNQNPHHRTAFKSYDSRTKKLWAKLRASVTGESAFATVVAEKMRRDKALKQFSLVHREHFVYEEDPRTVEAKATLRASKTALQQIQAMLAQLDALPEDADISALDDVAVAHTAVERNQQQPVTGATMRGDAVHNKQGNHSVPTAHSSDPRNSDSLQPLVETPGMTSHGGATSESPTVGGASNAPTASTTTPTAGVAATAAAAAVATTMTTATAALSMPSSMPPPQTRAAMTYTVRQKREQRRAILLEQIAKAQDKVGECVCMIGNISQVLRCPGCLLHVAKVFCAPYVWVQCCCVGSWCCAAASQIRGCE